ncbi:MAG: hypothetical protein WCR52_24115 [Bacteroidota bacterium]
MNYMHINHLLDKYWDGETTLDEERLLKAYFASEAVDPRLVQFAPLFKAMKAEQAVVYEKQTVVKELGIRRFQTHQWATAASVALLLAAGAWWATKQNTISTDAPVAIVNEAPPTSNTPIEITIPTVQPQAITAAPKTKSKRTSTAKAQLASSRITISERNAAKKAYAELKAALALVSSKLSRGRKEAAKSLNQLDSIDKIFKKKKESDG